MTPSEFFAMLSESFGWQNKRTFWDENKYGKKPLHYFVWRFLPGSYVDADDEVDIKVTPCRGSFFSKNSGEIDSVREQAEALALENGLTVDSHVYDDYESDTGYHHFDIDFTFYEEV